MIWLVIIFLAVAFTAHVPELVGWVVDKYETWLYAGSKRGRRK